MPEVEGAEEAPGTKEGGVLEHITREVTVEALPTEIPDRIVVDVSRMDINDTIQLSMVTPPQGSTFVADDLEEITIAAKKASVDLRARPLAKAKTALPSVQKARRRLAAALY